MRLAPVLILLVAVLFVLSLASGKAPVGLGQSLAALISSDGTPLSVVMREIRLPLALLAAMMAASSDWL